MRTIKEVAPCQACHEKWLAKVGGPSLLAVFTIREAQAADPCTHGKAVTQEVLTCTNCGQDQRLDFGPACCSCGGRLE